jgi:response regulator RpfG family c-di-GMP phosphodiesterase
MNNRLLLVDDEPKVLAGLALHLAEQYDIDTADSGAAGLERVRENSDYAVVISDMRMPGMTGIEFLQQVGQLRPMTSRILLTGFAELNVTIDAINEGHVFRFLTKPCPQQQLLTAVQAGMRQFQLVQAEKELVEGTLHGSIQVLSEVISLSNPLAFGRNDRVRRLTLAVAKCLGIESDWELDVAAMLNQLGCVAVPAYVIEKIFRNVPLTQDEQSAFDRHPETAQRLLSGIPRMEGVARILAYQTKHFNGDGSPRDRLAGSQIPLASRILKAVTDYDLFDCHGQPAADILHRMKQRSDVYDPVVIQALCHATDQELRATTHELMLDQVREGMIFDADVIDKENRVIVAKGQKATKSLLSRLAVFARNAGIREPLLVREEPHSIATTVDSSAAERMLTPT